MKQVRRFIIGLCVMFYISLLLFILGITASDSIKYLLIFLGLIFFIVIYFLVLKKIKLNKEGKQKITAEQRKDILRKINKLKKIVSFFTFLFMIICILLGLSNDGEFVIKYLYPFFKKRVSSNEVFNWILRISPLCFITAIYNTYEAIIQISIEKFGLTSVNSEES